MTNVIPCGTRMDWNQCSRSAPIITAMDNNTENREKTMTAIKIGICTVDLMEQAAWRIWRLRENMLLCAPFFAISDTLYAVKSNKYAQKQRMIWWETNEKGTKSQMQQTKPHVLPVFIYG